MFNLGVSDDNLSTLLGLSQCFWCFESIAQQTLRLRPPKDCVWKMFRWIFFSVWDSIVIHSPVCCSFGPIFSQSVQSEISKDFCLRKWTTGMRGSVMVFRIFPNGISWVPQLTSYIKLLWDHFLSYFAPVSGGIWSFRFGGLVSFMRYQYIPCKHFPHRLTGCNSCLSNLFRDWSIVLRLCFPLFCPSCMDQNPLKSYILIERW